MARYIVLERSFINDRLAEPGEVIDYAGKAGVTLQLVEDDAPEADGKPARKPREPRKPSESKPAPTDDDPLS